MLPCVQLGPEHVGHHGMCAALRVACRPPIPFSSALPKSIAKSKMPPLCPAYPHKPAGGSSFRRVETRRPGPSVFSCQRFVNCEVRFMYSAKSCRRNQCKVYRRVLRPAELSPVPTCRGCSISDFNNVKLPAHNLDGSGLLLALSLNTAV
jgi:hypothetical protein